MTLDSRQAVRSSRTPSCGNQPAHISLDPRVAKTRCAARTTQTKRGAAQSPDPGGASPCTLDKNAYISVEASRSLDVPVPVWVQASTLAIYGDAGDSVLDEMAKAANGPPQMAGVARAWEAAVDGANTDRLVVLRTGIVLDNDAPALDRLRWLARWGLGGRVGPGTQWISWVHIDDWLAIVRTALARGSGLEGVLHATGPEPTRNADLMAALRRSVGRPLAPPTPALLVRLGAVLLRTDPALALTGRRAIPARLLARGFQFAHPDLDEALADLQTRRSKQV